MGKIGISIPCESLGYSYLVCKNVFSGSLTPRPIQTPGKTWIDGCENTSKVDILQTSVLSTSCSFVKCTESTDVHIAFKATTS